MWKRCLSLCLVVCPLALHAVPPGDLLEGLPEDDGVPPQCGSLLDGIADDVAVTLAPAPKLDVSEEVRAKLDDPLEHALARAGDDDAFDVGFWARGSSTGPLFGTLLELGLRVLHADGRYVVRVEATKAELLRALPRVLAEIEIVDLRWRVHRNAAKKMTPRLLAALRHGTTPVRIVVAGQAALDQIRGLLVRRGAEPESSELDETTGFAALSVRLDTEGVLAIAANRQVREVDVGGLEL